MARYCDVLPIFEGNYTDRQRRLKMQAPVGSTASDEASNEQRSRRRHPSGTRRGTSWGIACHRCEIVTVYDASDVRSGYDEELGSLGYVAYCPHCHAEIEVPEHLLTDKVKSQARPVDPA